MSSPPLSLVSWWVKHFFPYNFIIIADIAASIHCYTNNATTTTHNIYCHISSFPLMSSSPPPIKSMYTASRHYQYHYYHQRRSPLSPSPTSNWPSLHHNPSTTIIIIPKTYQNKTSYSRYLITIIIIPKTYQNKLHHPSHLIIITKTLKKTIITIQNTTKTDTLPSANLTTTSWLEHFKHLSINTKFKNQNLNF